VSILAIGDTLGDAVDLGLKGVDSGFGRFYIVTDAVLIRPTEIPMTRDLLSNGESDMQVVSRLVDTPMSTLEFLVPILSTLF
jgi:hypothetical protein